MNRNSFYFRSTNNKNRIYTFISKSFLFTIIFLLLFPLLGAAQVGVNTTDIDYSAILEISSTDMGVLFPSITILERDAMDLAAASGTGIPEGLMIYCEDCCDNGAAAATGAPYSYNGAEWTPLSSDCRDLYAPPECLDLVITIDSPEQMDQTITPPLLTDGILLDCCQPNWASTRLSTQTEDVVNFDFNDTLPAGFKVVFNFYNGLDGIDVDLYDNGSIHQSFNSDATLPTNVTKTGGIDDDNEVEIILLADTDSVVVYDFGGPSGPIGDYSAIYLYEIRVFDLDGNEVPFTCT